MDRKWLQMARQGAGSDEAGTVGGAPSWKASTPWKMPGLHLTGNGKPLKGFNWDKNGLGLKLRSSIDESCLASTGSYMEQCSSHTLIASLPLSSHHGSFTCRSKSDLNL